LDRLAEESPKDFVKCAIALLPKDVLIEMGSVTQQVIADMTEFARDYRLVRAAREAIGAPLMLECSDD
jgi:hypothetical protein